MLSDFLQDNGYLLSLLLASTAIVTALLLVRWIMSKDSGTPRMREVAHAVQTGARAYLKRQVMTISVFIVLIGIALMFIRDLTTSIGFVAGALFSLAAGYIGMTIAVRANVRTAAAAMDSKFAALRVAFNGGAVTGLLVVGMALLSVGLFFVLVQKFTGDLRMAVHTLVGLALGSSLISVFARLGGGIYTKAADVGADLVGKIESGLDEDDPRNPATIADNVGDNVGDCAGMAADVFETYAVSLIGAILVAYLTLPGNEAALQFPFLIGGISVLGALAGMSYVNIVKRPPARSLNEAVIVAGLVSAALLWPVVSALFPGTAVIGDKEVSAAGIFGAALIGLVMTFISVWITNYYTATEFKPVRSIADACQTGHATAIIRGLSVGQHATALPVVFIGVAILCSFSLAGLYGIAIAVMAMLSMAGIIISLDAYGPITDNAGGIAMMGGMPKDVRGVTDELDAVGNTMKAVTKGYAIASAGLAALVLFGSYVEELRMHKSLDREEFTRLFSFSLSEPEVIIGLFLGGLLPFVFTAFSMDAVGKAAGAVVKEVRRQLSEKPGILKGEDTPDYGACVDIVTKSALREMIIPALLPVVFVVGVALLPGMGEVVLGGVLVGTIVTGLFVGISMTSSGGAWDNAKKFIEEGNFGGKGSDAHAAAVTGDTVGDPYKDTAGPAVNPMIKVVNVLAILIIPFLLSGSPDKDAEQRTPLSGAPHQQIEVF